MKKTTTTQQNPAGDFGSLRQPENVQALLDSLRDHYITYKEHAMRCHVELKTSSSDEKQRYFYFPPKVSMLEEPEKQKAHRKQFIQEVGQVPEPEPLVLISDVLHKDLLETVGDRSNPNIVRQDFARFYKRRVAQLQHKKYKVLNRWSNQALTSEYIDKTGINLDACLGRIQQELDLAINRCDRLSVDDNYSLAHGDNRPHPTAKEENKEQKPLYLEANHVSINSAIRQDDIEVYLRLVTYRNKIHRVANKLTTDIKYLPYSSRFDIWAESRVMMSDLKQKYQEKKFKVFQEVSKRIKVKLETNGVQEERVMQAIIDKFTKHLKGEEFHTRSDQIFNSHKTNHEQPPLILANNIELKLQLQQLAKEFGITGDLEIDNGHSFTYQISVYYPTHFERQVQKLQFDWHDTGVDGDSETVEKIGKNLGLNNKNQVIDTMSRISELERTKSILGKINTSDPLSGTTKGDRSKKPNDGSNFFSLDETEFKLKSADWLPLVIFEGIPSETLKRQSHYLNQIQEYDTLLSSAFNFLDVNDSGAVNKILEESAGVHAQRAQKRNPTRTEGLIKTREDEIQANLKQAVGQGKLDPQLLEMIRLSEQPLIEPLPTHIVKAYYTLRFLKSRDHKIKLMHILNYFRSIQKRLALDLSQFTTRDRALGDMELIPPQFGKEQNGNPRHLMNGNSGAGGIFQMHLHRQLDDPEQNDKHKSHPISIKALKYNQQFRPNLSSTNPSLPRLHATFGRPRLYEQISDAIDKKTVFDGNWNKESRKFMGRQDKCQIDHINKDVTIFDEYGIKIVYEESLNDLLDLEEELLKICTYYLQQSEFLLDADLKEPSSAVDRGELALHIFGAEVEFQFEKMLMVEQMMEGYEHTCDPLEQVRLIQIIADLMTLRPRLNLHSTYFQDSYTSEIDLLKHKRDFYRDFLSGQALVEDQENEELRKFQELKFRKVQDHIEQQWLYRENKLREERIGAREEETVKVKVTDTIKSRLEQKGIVDPEKRQRMKEIAQRHITEFANNQYSDFQDVLGLPEVTAEELFSKQGQKEPLLTDCLREHAHFSKQMEGYPWFMSQTDKLSLYGIDQRKHGLLDFYESFGSLTRVNAALVQALDELVRVHTPENGLAVSCLERALIFEAKGKLMLLRKLQSDEEYLVTKSTLRIEEDLYLSNSDKLIFLMREFKSHLAPEQIFEKANPLLVAKLDIDSVSKFDFPRLKQKDIKDNDDLTQDEILTRMIDLAKVTVTGSTQEEKLIGGNLHIEDFMEKRGNSKLPEVVKAPSLMIMSCNMIEVMRLREELIQRIHETDVLSIIYKSQLKHCNKDSFKLVLSDSINFDTQSIIKDSMNMIDMNDGSKLDFDLPFREFDISLRAGLDFRSESCIKALFTDLGVEELRAILHYQVMQQQILQIAIMINQPLMDGCLKGIYELDFLTKKRPFSVPNSVINLHQILSKTGDGYNAEMFNREKNKLRQILQREVGDLIYSINAKKSKQRPYIVKRYGNVLQKVQTFTQKAEVKLRILRSYRLKLCHSYCKEVLREAYQDAIKIQALQTSQNLRQYTLLLPKDANVFQYGMSDLLENLPQDLIKSLQSNFHKDSSKVNISLLLSSKFDTLFYVPSSTEIMELDRSSDEKELQLQNQVQFTDQINEELMDKQVKEMCKVPTQKYGYKQDEGILKPLRKVHFQEAYQYNSQSFKLLQYLTLIYRIFKLEYLMGRNNSPGLDVLEMEDSILCGRSYWDRHPSQDHHSQNPDMPLSDLVISKIVNQRRARIDLAEDLNSISLRLQEMNKWPKKFTIENLKIENMLELLHLQHQKLYAKFLYGIENLLETYLDKKNDENFSKILDVRDLLLKKNATLRMHANGFTMQKVQISPYHININKHYLADDQDFMQVYQPIIDEEQLMPQEYLIVRSLYSQDLYLENQTLDLLTKGYIRDYSQLDNCFLNLKDSERAYVYANIFQLDERMQEYLQYKGIKDPRGDIKEVLNAKIEFLNLKNECVQLQAALMSWMGKGELPRTTHEYEKMLRQYKDQMMMKILQERDQLNDQSAKTKDKKQSTANGLSSGLGGQNDYGQKVKRESVMEAVGYNVEEQHFLNKLNEKKAEINVIKRELEIRMIKQSIQLIKNEHSSLLATFDQASCDKEIAVFINPQQQFASTLYQSVDKNAHLDIANKLSFVQSFLTRLRNRCTEVETLTSGPGIVFSLKDFNECLQIMCRGLAKYGEQELRTRIESGALRETQYRHLVYLKEQQNLYLRRKCEQFQKEMDKLINAKLTQKGNQIIYELDITNRELRMLKDNFYMMERLMRQEMRHEFERTIQEKDNEIAKFKESFLAYKSELNNEIKEEVAKEILGLDKKVKTIVQKKDTITHGAAALSGSQRGNAKKFSYNRGGVDQTLSQSNLDPNSTTMQPSKNQGYYDAETVKEINSLNRFIRKFKIFTQMKEVIAQEKHERELHNQRQRLTSNECLWEQLAESEKREQIIKQELYYTQQSLASYEKLLEKLQVQLETLQNQTLRLQQYKNSKSKRIEELEGKMRDVEVMENVDLNKVLEELRMRDKRLGELERVDRNIQQRVDQVQRVNHKKVVEMQKKFEKEKDMKNQAISKLESMRLEMRALEGRDFSNDLWKDKCKELFEICKDLQKENEDLKQEAALQQQYPQTTMSPTSGHGYEKKLQSFHSQEPTTKPSTAGGMKFNQQSRILSRGVPTGAVISQLGQIPEGTLTSGLSLPEILAQETEDNLSPNSSKLRSEFLRSNAKFQTQSNFNPTKSRETTIKQQQPSDHHMAQAFTSAGTLSEQTRKFGKTSYLNRDRGSLGVSDVLQGLQAANHEQMASLASGDHTMKHNGLASINSQQMSKSQSRGTALMAGQQSKFKQKRLKTSQGGRRPQDGVNTGGMQSSQINTFKDSAPMRKSGHNLHYSRQQQHQNLTANLAGLQIAHGLTPLTSNNGQQIFGGNRGSINLNINFNTTNITMPK